MQRGKKKCGERVVVQTTAGLTFNEPENSHGITMRPECHSIHSLVQAPGFGHEQTGKYSGRRSAFFVMLEEPRMVFDGGTGSGTRSDRSFGHFLASMRIAGTERLMGMKLVNSREPTGIIDARPRLQQQQQHHKNVDFIQA